MEPTVKESKNSADELGGHHTDALATLIQGPLNPDQIEARLEGLEKLTKEEILTQIAQEFAAIAREKKYNSITATPATPSGQFRSNILRELERRVQKRWEAERVLELGDATGDDASACPVFVASFSQPHILHAPSLRSAVTVLKAEFSAAFHRLCGEQVLVPFLYNTSGPQIMNAVTYIKHACTQGDHRLSDSIVKGLGIAKEDLHLFTNEERVTAHFMQSAERTLKHLGLGIDWRRVAVSAGRNPYYHSFIVWMINSLHSRNLIAFGTRYAILSLKEKQQCFPYGIDVLTKSAIKIEIPRASLPPRLADVISPRKRVFLLALTQRPELLYGQTHVWVSTAADFVAWPTVNGEVFVTSELTARNFSYQRLTSERGKFHQLAKVRGSALCGILVHSPLSPYPNGIYTLPLIGQDGNTVRIAVPSESARDATVLRQLAEPENRTKYNLTETMLASFPPVAIINTPKNGNMPGIAACVAQPRGVASGIVDDAIALISWNTGTMLVGAYAGMAVKEARMLLVKALQEAGQLIAYAEPSDDQNSLVAASCETYYLKCGEPAWHERTVQALMRMKLPPETERVLQRAVEWVAQVNYTMSSTAQCAGVRLPFNAKHTLASSMEHALCEAYCSVAHLLHSDAEGSKVGALGLKPGQLTTSLWDMVVLGAAYDASCGVPHEIVTRLRQTYCRWSGPATHFAQQSDANEVACALYLHTALLPLEHWPRSVHLSGNLTWEGARYTRSFTQNDTMESMDQYSVDAVRFAFANASIEGLDDVPLTRGVMDTAVLRLTAQLQWTREMYAALPSMRDGPMALVDLILQAEVNLLVHQTRAACAASYFREMLQTGFFHLQTSRDHYVNSCALMGIATHRSLMLRFMEVQAVLLSIVCPHVAEQMWSELGHSRSILRASFPEADNPDLELLAKGDFIASIVHSSREKLAIAALNHRGQRDRSSRAMVIYVRSTYAEWERRVLVRLRDLWHKNGGKIPENENLAPLLTTPADLKPQRQAVMYFAAQVVKEAQQKGERAFALERDDLSIFHRFRAYLCAVLDVEQVLIYRAESTVMDPQNRKKFATPGKPAVAFIRPKVL